MRNTTASTDQAYLRDDQYRDSRNLSARYALHARFSVNPQSFLRWVFDQFALPPQAQVLELGCGRGDLWQRNLDRIPAGWEITLSDFSPGMLEDARETLAPAPRPFSYAVLDAQSIARPDASSDAVVANHMLYHVPAVPRALAEIRRVLRPGGTLFAATNGRAHLRELWDFLAEFDGVPNAASDATRGFDLENGRSLLSEHFAHVALHRFDDALEVTEVGPLVAYVLSMMDTALVARVARNPDSFRAFVSGRLSRGPLHIGKSAGLFAAR